jgi:PKHD-type hydroxylase
MNFPVHYFVPPVFPHSIWNDAFTPEDCDKIIALAELMAHEQGGFRPGIVGQRQNEDGSRGQHNPEARITDVLFIEPNRENDWIHHRVSHIVGRRNSDMYQLDLAGFDGFQFSLYDGAAGGHYGWHMDMQTEPPNPAQHRKLSVVVMLSDPDEYEGGDLVLLPFGSPDRELRLRPKKGEMVFFYSFIPHKVEPVTKGKRCSLVTWAVGEKFR